MAGIKLLTRHDAKTCLKLAWRSAQDLGFTLTPIDESSTHFTATSGNAVLGLLAGALAPYCNFQICVGCYSDGNELSLEMNTPWLSGGAIGVKRIRGKAEELLGAIASAIERDGGTILERRNF